ncbi:hypothetical protein D048_1229, partial [Vibrio parahaemolyticus VPTS-2009]
MFYFQIALLLSYKSIF